MLKTAKNDLVAFVTNLTKKIPGPTNSKERYELLIENKSQKVNITSKTVTIPKNGDTKSVTISKLLKLITQSNN